MPKTPPKEPKDYFASVMAPGTKKIAIVSRRIGTKERLHQIAVVTSEMVADRIVEALNHHQGTLEKLDAKLQPRVDALEEQLSRARSEYNEMRQKNNGLHHENDRLKRELQNAIRERDAAQRRVHELTPTTHPALAST